MQVGTRYNTDTINPPTYINYYRDPYNYIFEYSFSNKGAEIRTHIRDVGTMEVATAKNFSEALYQKTKQKLDRVNANIKNYQYTPCLQKSCHLLLYLFLF